MLGAVTLSPESLDPIITEMGRKYNVEPALIKAHIKQESNWDVNASRYEAHKKDASWGLMQLLLTTARGVLGDPNLTTTQLIQPRVNIEAGTKLIADNWRRWGNIRDAIAAYNAGSPRLDPTTGKYVNSKYVDNVTKYYNLYKQLGTTAGNVVIAATEESAMPVYALMGVGLVGMLYATRKE